MIMQSLTSLLVTGSVLLVSVQVTTCGLKSSQAARANEKRVREASCMAEYGTPICPDENRIVITDKTVQHQAISVDTAQASGTSASSQRGKLEYFGPEKPADPFLRLHSFNFEERKKACTELLASKVDRRRVSDALQEILATEQDALRLRASMYCATELGSSGSQLTSSVRSILERSLREDLRKADDQMVYLEEATFFALTAVSPDQRETARFLTILAERPLEAATLARVAQGLGTTGKFGKAPLRILLAHKEPTVRGSALSAIRNLGLEEARQLAPEIILALADPEPSVVQEALNTVQRLELAVQARQALYRRLSDETFGPQIGAILRKGGLSEYPIGYLAPVYDSTGRVDRGIPLFDRPHGVVVGQARLWMKSENDSTYELEPETVQGVPVNVTDIDRYDAGYHNDAAFPMYYAQREGFVRILVNSVPGGVWVRQSDIASSFKSTTWMEDLTENVAMLSGYDGLLMREEASVAAEVILRLKMDKHLINEIREVKGQWARVEVLETRVPFEPCEGSSLEESLTGRSWIGWVKLLNEYGQPDVLYSEGCC